MKTAVEGETRGPTDPTHIELPYIVPEPLQIHQQGLIIKLNVAEALEIRTSSVASEREIRWRWDVTDSSSDSSTRCRLPLWTEVTRAPVESQVASKPKSLLLLGFWFRLMRISQWF